MKIEKQDYFIIVFVIFSALFLIASACYAGEYHHSRPIMPSNTTNITNVTESNGIALSIAASQHHYKATTALQWSIGGGSYGGTSAVSGGLGLQIGKVFASCNASSDGLTSAFGCGIGGTF